VLIGLIQLLAISNKSVEMRKDDFVGAYKTLPLKQEELDLAVAICKDLIGEVRALQLWSCPFGSLGSVHAWHRVGASFQLILSRLFFVPYGRYVDDLLGADAVCTEELDMNSNMCNFASPTGTADLVRCVIHVLLGWDLDKHKEETGASQMTGLGVEVSILNKDRAIRLHISEARIAKWMATIAEILRQERLTAADAKKLAGH
jgi:hypothetical protein